MKGGDILKQGRNEPCLCGSGKKFKKCCIDKEKYEELFYKQRALMLEVGDEKVYHEIISLGEIITSTEQKYVFTTGAYNNMATAYLNLGDVENALGHINKALELKPHNYQALVNKFAIYMKDANYHEAHTILKKFKGLTFNDELRNQVITRFQATVIGNTSKQFVADSVKELESILDTLFELMESFDGLLMLAHEFYWGIGDDVLKAYEFGKKFAESYDNAQTYTNLGFLCLDDRINRPLEGIMYLNKAIEIADDEDVLLGARTNLVHAFIRNGDSDKARTLVEELVKNTPSNANYSNYAELLKREEEYDGAIEWCKKALFLVEDDTTLLVLADTYKKNMQYEEAIENFIKCIGTIESDGNVYRFNDACGTERYSFATNTSISTMMIESYIGVIESYNRLNKFSEARAYLTIGMENFPNERSLEALNSVLPFVEDIQSEYIKAKDRLEKEREISLTQRNCLRKWASDLMLLQDSAYGSDFDSNMEWDKFEEQMNLIVLAMQNSANANGDLLVDIERIIEETHPNIENKSKEFLKTANYLYELHKDTIIDFAPIIVEYSKIVETQLRHKLANRLNGDEKMLGQIIWKIRNESNMPYKNSLSKLDKVNRLRKKSAYTGILTLYDANNIRRMLFNEGLLVTH